MNEPPFHPGLAHGPIYLDYNGTTPIDPRVVDAMLPYLSTHFGNPSSTQAYAQVARVAVEKARAQVAELLACASSEIIFTGSGSESDALAIRGAALALRSRGTHVITQRTEHPAVRETCHMLERLYGFQITELAVDHLGRVRPSDLEAALTEQTVLVTIMLANNETGTLQPVAELARLAHQHHALFHTDAAQAVGKIPLSVDALGVDLLTVVGHKLYAPKGVGALYVRQGTPLEPLIPGGGQEQARRAGTENVALLVALGAACELAAQELAVNPQRLRTLRDRLHRRLSESLPDLVHLNGHPTERLPTTLNISIDGVVGEAVLAATPEIAAATGSACHAGSMEPSTVLLAQGMERARALGALRLTLGRWSTAEEIERAAHLLTQTIWRILATSSPRHSG